MNLAVRQPTQGACDRYAPHPEGMAEAEIELPSEQSIRLRIIRTSGQSGLAARKSASLGLTMRTQS